MSDYVGTRVGVPLTAFAIGAAVGAGIALLYAPRSGQETRQLLARRSRDVKERLRGAADATRDAIHDQWQKQPTTS